MKMQLRAECRIYKFTSVSRFENILLSFLFNVVLYLSSCLVQHYRVIQTPDGNQTVALKSTSREKDLDNRVKTKSDRFCMHT